MSQQDLNDLAEALFTLASKLEQISPGLAVKHGWAEIVDLTRFTNALESASQATKPHGLL